METHKLIFAFCFLVFSFTKVSKGVSEATKRDMHHGGLNNVHPTKLFVFGDSYADTGNTDHSSSWKVPYGITFPGKPSGRFSDGRVITDYLATFLGLQTPIPYKLRKSPVEQLKYGMNFAFGGTGVFETLVSGPNLNTQIDFLQNLVTEAVYTQQDLETSLVFVTTSGNDYSTYLNKGGSVQDLPKFSSRLVNQLAVDLKRFGSMGVGKIAVTTLEPLGCLPLITIFSSFQQCNKILNAAATQHNVFLQQAVAKLNNETKGSPFVILDIYNTILAALENKGSTKFETPLKPCCTGINASDSCGSVDQNGKLMYTVCNNPGAAFFWDIVHPTQAGWNTVFLSLKSSLQSLFF